MGKALMRRKKKGKERVGGEEKGPTGKNFSKSLRLHDNARKKKNRGRYGPLEDT